MELEITWKRAAIRPLTRSNLLRPGWPRVGIVRSNLNQLGNRRLVFPIVRCLLVALSGLLSLMHSSAQTPANSLRLETDGPTLRLRYSLAETNGIFFLLQSDQLTNLLGAGQVLASGVAASNRTGVFDVPRPTNSTAFFGLLLTAPSTEAGIRTPIMVRIPAGSFVMGAPSPESWRDLQERQRPVTLTKDFYMSKHELTQKEYLAVIGNNPSSFTGDLNRPVEQVISYLLRSRRFEALNGSNPFGIFGVLGGFSPLGQRTSPSLDIRVGSIPTLANGQVHGEPPRHFWLALGP